MTSVKFRFDLVIGYTKYFHRRSFMEPIRLVLVSNEPSILIVFVLCASKTENRNNIRDVAFRHVDRRDRFICIL